MSTIRDVACGEVAGMMGRAESAAARTRPMAAGAGVHHLRPVAAQPGRAVAFPGGHEPEREAAQRLLQVVLLTADRHPIEVLSGLHEFGFNLLITPWHGTFAPQSGPLPPDLLLVALESQPPLAQLARTTHQRRIPWIAWNCTDDPALTLAAYSSGAMVVLPAQITASVLLQAIQNALATTDQPRALLPQGVIERRYTRDTPLMFEQDAVLEVRAGVIAVKAVHHDGTAMLLGLLGPGQILTVHPHDSCGIQLVAHSDTVVGVQSWRQATADPAFAERLRTRIMYMEAWSAIQARPHLEQRVLGLLMLLAEQFGVARPEGTLVDVRLTHHLLGSAVGATRTTITRLVRTLRQCGLLATVGDGTAERFVLLGWDRREHGGHGLSGPPGGRGRDER